MKFRSLLVASVFLVSGVAACSPEATSEQIAYATLSEISFKAHITQRKALCDKQHQWCRNSKYEHSIYNILNKMLSSILTAQDDNEIGKLYLRHQYNSDFRENDLIYIPKYIANNIKHLQSMSTAMWNYIILFNYLKKHTLQVLGKSVYDKNRINIINNICREDKLKRRMDISPNGETANSKSNLYVHYKSIFWNDDEAIEHVRREGEMLKQFLTENDLMNEDIEKKITKAENDSSRYVLATDLHRYISVQNAITYKIRNEGGFCTYVPKQTIRMVHISDIPKKELSNMIIYPEDKTGLTFEYECGDIETGFHETIATPYAYMNKMDKFKNTRDERATYVLSIPLFKPLEKLLMRDHIYDKGDISSNSFDVYKVRLPIFATCWENPQDYYKSTGAMAPILINKLIDGFGNETDITMIEDTGTMNYLIKEYKARIDEISEKIGVKKFIRKFLRVR